MKKMPFTFGNVLQIATKAVAFAQASNEPIAFDFNGVEVVAQPNSNPEDIAHIAMLKFSQYAASLAQG